MKTIYLFPGLGADGRIFDHYTFSGYQKRVMDWYKPTKQETLSQYAQRYVSEIKEDNPILIGVSFGGMVASELSQLIPGAKLILISSAARAKELPVIYQLCGQLKITRFLPAKLMLTPNPMIHWLFGAQNQLLKQLLTNILKETDPRFLKWALHAIATWKAKQIPINTLRIHGSKDWIIPSPKLDHLYLLEGGHLAVVQQQAAIEGKIINWLAKS